MTPLSASLSDKLNENLCREDFSPSELQELAQFQAERLEKAKRVGALLREQHYLATLNPPSGWNPETRSEAEYWTDYAMSAPGLDESRVLAETIRRRNASSIAEAEKALPENGGKRDQGAGGRKA